MTSTPPKVDAKRVKKAFKPDIRLANAVVKAVAFLQKSGFKATPQVIKRFITEKSKKRFSSGLDQLALYLIRGLELGILRKYQGGYRLGDFKPKKAPKKPMESTEQPAKVIKEVAKKMQSICRVNGSSPSFCVCFK